jgi:co-chaperonin GroES (HSP10)
MSRLINPNDPIYGSQHNLTGIEPLGYKILVELTEATEVTKYASSLVIPDSVAERYQNASVTAKVLQIGAGAYNKEKFPEGPWCGAGDIVILSPYAGTRIKSALVPGALRIINDDSIDAKVFSSDIVERG